MDWPESRFDWFFTNETNFELQMPTKKCPTLGQTYIRSDAYKETRGMLKIFLENVIPDVPWERNPWRAQIQVQCKKLYSNFTQLYV